MKKLYIFLAILALNSGNIIAQEFDLTFTNTESGTQTHIARNSVTLGPGYTYTPGGGTMDINIQNPVVTGPMTYNGTPVDPQSRTLTTSYLVGATNGSLNVNALGGATYAIPIEVPPGLNGLAPNLSLTYSSNSGPGIAGYGWNISGLSAISRGPKTYYNDGTAKGISLDTTDRFYIDGQRLVTTNSYAYGNALSEYQTDNDIFTRVKQYGTDANGPAYFIAETKAGIVFEYGNSPGSKQKINGFQQVVNWYVSKASDLFGNQINITYLQDNFNVYPAEITYGPNTITFYYKERLDVSSSYLKGTKLQQRFLLDKITVKYNSNIVKSYEFKYNYCGSDYNKYSALNEVIEYGIGTNRLNSTAFTYQVPDNVSFSQAFGVSHSYINYNAKLITGDFNGDGKEDILSLPEGGGWRYYRNVGDNVFVLSSSGNFSVTGILDITAVDLNGDNKDDLLIDPLMSDRFYYAISDGTTFGNDIFFSESSGGLFLWLKTKSRNGDINGDGLNDCLIIRLTGEIKWYSYSYNNGQLTPISLRATLNLGSISSSDHIFLSDFNGDGLAEIWKINDSGMKIYAIRGQSLVELYTSPTPTKNNVYSVGDFNGDGKADLFVYGTTSSDWSIWQIRLSIGTSFECFNVPQKKANLRNDIVRIGDFDGNGATDLMITANSDNGWTGHYYYISKNYGTDFHSYYYSSGPLASNKYYIADYNGDGRDDYLLIDGVSPWTSGYKVYNTPGKTNFLIEKVGNGLGYLAIISYKNLSQASTFVFNRGTGASFPVSDYQGHIPVVSEIQYDNGKGTMNTRKYYYEGFKIHKQGKGFLGYYKTKLTEVATGIIMENTSSYNTTYFCPSVTSSSKSISGSGPYETVTNTWYLKVLHTGKKRIFPYIKSSTQTNNLTGNSVTVTSNYDNYGNPTSITKTLSNGISYTTTQVYENIISSTKWLLGRPTSTTIQHSGSGSTITRSGTKVFNTNNNTLTNETWHNSTTVAVRNAYEYNTNGTLKKQTVTDLYRNISRSIDYTYEASNGIRVSTVKDPLLHTTSNTYDSYGRLYTQQDYLANQITYTYDNLHRQVSVTKSDGSGASTTYAWENPASTPLLARYSIKTDGLDGSQTKVWYDKLGREIRSDVKGFDGTMVHNDNEYDIKGQVYRVSEPYTSGSAVWNTFTYDNYGRKTGLTTPSGANSTWQYTGNTVTETTAGKTYTKTFAADGTVISATDAGGIISYAYYPDGQLKSVTAPGNIATQMEYDIAGNQKKLIDPSAGVTEYTYNSFGELLTQKNARNQTTTLTYLSDGRLQQKVTPEGTTTYTYNTNKQLTNISSPGSISRAYSYDTKGRISTLTETIPGSPNSFPTSFTYDTKGRLYEITHPSGIIERNGYNSYGYLSGFGNGSTTLYTTSSVNARGQITSGMLGNNLQLYNSYNAYGFLTTTNAVPTNGNPPVQSYSYDFNSVTGNLNNRIRYNQSASIQENFEYDNLNRLDRVYRGSTTLLDMAYDGNKGGITTKSDVGTMSYGVTGKPYALGTINPSTGLIPATLDSITYTSFESVNLIWEGAYKANFAYNSDNERAKMVVQQNNSDILTRWYPNSRYIKEIAGGVTKEYTFMGGDAYTAPVVAIKQGTTITYYYLLRDHLGSITHVVNASNSSLAAEYSYDSWGRMRNVSTWTNYAPGSEPALMIAGRGFTGHEHLPWFNLINMNGRVYDPLTGQFLSPDNYVQNPGFTQSFNRYGYCLNNPLAYTDASGENWGWVWWIVGGVAGGAINVAQNWDNIDNFGEGFAYFNVGGLAGSGAAVLADNGVGGPGIGMFYNWITNTGNGFIEGNSTDEIITSGTQGAIWGGISGFAMEGLAAGINGLMNISWTDYRQFDGYSAHTYPKISLYEYLGLDVPLEINTNGLLSTPLPFKEVTRIKEVIITPSGGSSGTPWIDAAYSEYNKNIAEMRGDAHNPRIIEYLKSAGLSGSYLKDETGWCASFVHWCLKQNDITGAGAQPRAYDTWGQSLDGPAYGALAVFKSSHIGFVVGQQGSNLIILHGNWSNRISLSDYIKSSEIKYYRYPSGYKFKLY